MARLLGLVVLVLFVLGAGGTCLSSSLFSGPGMTRSMAETEEVEVRECSLGRASVLAVLDDGGCGHLLTERGPGDVILESSVTAHGGGTKRVGEGPVPEFCFPLSRCEFGGIVGSFGPLLVVQQRGLHSEIPQDVWLGTLHDGIWRYVSLWPGERVLSEGTPAGPLFALVPHRCGEHLTLLAQPRLPIPDLEVLSEYSRAHEGVLDVRTGLWKRGPLAGIRRAACEPFALDLP